MKTDQIAGKYRIPVVRMRFLKQGRKRLQMIRITAKFRKSMVFLEDLQRRVKYFQNSNWLTNGSVVVATSKGNRRKQSCEEKSSVEYCREQNRFLFLKASQVF